MTMRRRALLTAAALAGPVLLAGAATAGPKAACNLVADPAGDATGFVVTGLPLPNDDALDIVSGDVASNKKLLTGVIRLASMAADSSSPTGRTYYVNFTINGTKAFLDAIVASDGSVTFNAGDFTGTNNGRKTLGAVEGVVDPAKKEIRITAPAGTWTESAKPGAKIAGLDLLAQRFIGTTTTGGVTPTADEAKSDAVYVAGSASCVTPGK
jgi:hypothetical protein